MVTETVDYYSNKGAKPGYLLFFDASKEFDRVSYERLFNLLLDRKECPRIVRLLVYMYKEQMCYVEKKVTNLFLCNCKI